MKLTSVKHDSSSWHHCTKEIFEHKESLSHKAALNLVAEAQKDIRERVYKISDSWKNITAEVFRTAYEVEKKNQSFNNFEGEINVQELNGEDMGRILHSPNACIVNHIGNEMRNTLVTKVINSRSKISLIIDESLTSKININCVCPSIHSWMWAHCTNNYLPHCFDTWILSAYQKNTLVII
jgi:hypothetical protein